MKPLPLYLLLLLPAPACAGAALGQLSGGAPVAEFTAPPPSAEGYTAKGGPVTQREAVARAQAWLDAALLRQGDYPKEKFWTKVKELRAAFDNKFDFRSASCEGGRRNRFLMFTKKAEFYAAQSSSRKKNIIHLCEGYAPGVELMAQDLLHEVSHLAFAAFENQATEFEMVTTALGGGYPVMSGYVSFNEGLTQEDLAWLGYDYLPFALGIDSKLTFRYQHLRANIIYDNMEVFEKNIAKLGDDLPKLLTMTDFRGFTLRGIAAKYGRPEFSQRLRELEAAAR